MSIFSKHDAVKQLKLLKERGVKELSNMFDPERPVTGKKLRHAIDDYCHFTPGTTKKIKSKHVEITADNMVDVDDTSTGFYVCTVIFKVVGKVEHRGKIVGYDPVNKLYQIVYGDDYTKQYYHNEVRDQQKRSLTKRRQCKKSKSAKIHYLYSKYAPKESDYVEHIMTLTVENIPSIASLRYNVVIYCKFNLQSEPRVLYVSRRCEK